jgi:nitrate/TMAO reductase-like tetraheme cytochrome c subunit
VANKEVWGKLTGLIDTREDFVDHRRSMAEREWKRMKENDSLGCRNCHEFEYMDFSEQGNRSVKCTLTPWHLVRKLVLIVIKVSLMSYPI